MGNPTEGTKPDLPFAAVTSLENQQVILNQTSSIGCMILSILLLVYVFGFGFFMFLDKDFAGEKIGFKLGMVAVFLFWLVLGIILLRKSMPRRKYTGAALYENGFAWIDKAGLHTARWDEVNEIFCSIVTQYVNGIKGGTRYQVDFHLGNGQLLRLDNSYKGLPDWMDYILSQTSKAQLPRYNQQLQNGQVLRFGSLGLDREKVYFNSKSLTWDKVIMIDLKEGKIHINDGSLFGWVKTEIKKIPNYQVFLQLAYQCQKAYPSK